jgi:hypothetical protein
MKTVCILSKDYFSISEDPRKSESKNQAFFNSRGFLSLHLARLHTVDH